MEARMQPTTENRDIAVQFLNLVIAGKIDEAYRNYVSMDGKHHNAFFAAGFAALSQAMKENHVQFPDKRLTVKHVLSDGDLVAVHSRIIPRDGDPGLIAVHLFRFDGGRIAEMWDCGQAIPAESPNRDGAF
jgi:predicted SnoaL-like aldol condensation-catalyzing enzyme